MKQRLILLLGLMLGVNVFSQDACAPLGWGTYGGSITGGGSATPTVVTTSSGLSSALGSSNKVIHISGTINISSQISVSGKTNITIIGLPGSKLVLSAGGLYFKSSCSNIILRNIIFQGPGSEDVNGDDPLCIDGCTRFWIDHCEFIDGLDGNFDIKNKSNYIAVTWCKFRYTSASTDHQFSNLIGSDDSDGNSSCYKITYQYCWWGTGCVERMPRVRFGNIHIANCYFNASGNSKTIMAGYNANIRIEGCVFESVKNPIDLENAAGTYVVKALNNTYTSCSTDSDGKKADGTYGSATPFTIPTGYAITVAAASTVKAAVTNTLCGAGATMDGPTLCGCSTPVEKVEAISNSIEIYPNPVSNGIIHVQLNVSESSTVSLELINILGQKVKTLAKSYYITGSYDVDCFVNDIPSGGYFIRMIRDDKVTYHKITISDNK